ncbi:hypothetical protein PM082_004431 [Marasmius tenuissimus]|nr:hypothetical protein PM082_004431 [Marasmius tenuissimus]
MAAVSANVVSDTARASAVATLSAIGNIGAVVATWSFLPFDAPDYKIGNGLNLATSSLMFVLSLLLYVWMMKDNKRRESRDGSQDLEGLSETDVMDLDWKHPRFRWHPVMRNTASWKHVPSHANTNLGAYKTRVAVRNTITVLRGVITIILTFPGNIDVNDTDQEL